MKRSSAFAGNPYKVEIAREIPAGEPMTLYTIGEFTDLCRGGHADSTGAIGAFKLTSVAGAYWRGDEHNPMLQRIYGTAWYDRGGARRVSRACRGSAAPRPSQAGRRARSLFDRRGSRRRPRLLASEGRDRPRHHRGFHSRRLARTRLPAGRHAARGQRASLRNLRSSRKLWREHVRSDRSRGSALPPQADELSRPHPHLPRAGFAAIASCRCAFRSSERSIASSAPACCTGSLAFAVSRRTTRTSSARPINCSASSSRRSMRRAG